MSDSETILARDISREQLLNELRALRPVFEREGVAHMALFGSRARGDHRPDSDVDLLIDVAPGRKFSMLDLIGIGHVVEDRVGLQGNVLIGRSLEAALADEARREAVEVF
jgi:predicted nucleotidyltransferase